MIKWIKIHPLATKLRTGTNCVRYEFPEEQMDVLA